MPKFHQIFGVKRFLNEESEKLVLFEKISDRYFNSFSLEKSLFTQKFARFYT